MNYSLRKISREDFDFLYNVLNRTMKEYVIAAFGRWDDELQHKHFASSWKPEKSQILVMNGMDAGELRLSISPDEIYVDRIYILPEFQNQGLGSAVMRDLLASARAQAQWVRLRVLKVNPATRFYRRLGFELTKTDDKYYYFEAAPHASED